MHKVEESKSGGLISILDKLNIFDAKVQEGRLLYDTEATSKDIIGGIAKDLGPEKTERLKHILHLSTVPSVHRFKANADYESNRSQELVNRYVKAGLSTGEYPTITALRDHCISEVSANRQAIVFYAHLKSASFSLPDKPAYWRDAMNAVVLEHPSICLRALLNGNSVCGTGYKTFPSSHYAGNFWWASCNHVAKLPPLRYPLFYWLDPEMFLMNVGSRSVTESFAVSCAYDVVALDTSRSMFNHPMTFRDYYQQITDHLSEKKLKKCGRITHTYRGKIRSAWQYDMQEVSTACRIRGGKRSKNHNMLSKKKPCLSLLTPPDIVPGNVNYYDISSDPGVAWSYGSDAYKGGVDTSDSAVNFTKYIKETWPVKFSPALLKKKNK